MKQDILKIAQDLKNNDITTIEAEKLLLGLFSVTKRFSKTEIDNIFRKVKTVIIKEDFKAILKDHFRHEEYSNKEDNEFFKKYAGKKVNVYEWAGDWWICEDDNYVITTDCFTELT